MTGATYEIPIMIVGDSISHGSSGHWTWRYRLWRHLRAHDVRLDLVGPKTGLDNVDPDGTTYADPDFDTYLAEKDAIEAKVAEHRPEYLLVLLGINDLLWHPVEPPRFEADLREFVANARRADPRLRIVVGRILPTRKAGDEPEFAARVAASNDRIEAVAADLNTDEAPLVVARTDAEFVAAEHTWDGTHPNPAGEYRIAAAFADILAAAFGLGAHYPRPFPRIADTPTAANSNTPTD
ncbi:GDSL-type esterase/lipase family protein [Embleya sp. NBC_00896]|uniref:SGNH/GDSL hydrolase family protein n=1 Tax=Embleya sp. NBC_00896 TaxID=2975961 RepID=UPI002F90CD6C|nr:GDSL-type esterase/lipase family protein [Embleya sp. NBC_00896]